MKKTEKRHKVFNMPFQIVYETEDFDRRLNLAIAGTPEIHEQDLDVADRVNNMRRKIEVAAMNDPRIHTPPTESDYQAQGDELIIEGEDENA